ncbi:hypothetical protein H8B09_12995 [Paenibacillus sp. PR3]|uniref:DUF7660 domain-containing protein n=1 Tax=Paenibacillus terricola TaxID=2763503 RepID=A0ABR8MUN2_9BACL|nr:hypothetical protein [Paenibacillus terricola]MBD3919674.1 hypothetical protein [Paenibacillus terricola]
MDPSKVSSKDELIAYLHELRRDLNEHAEDWENPTLNRFLEAMEAWLSDSGAYSDSLTWSVFATTLAAGKAYE